MSTPKYVAYVCDGSQLCGGLVDRFKGILDAYSWSLFTGRRLIVNITQPCDLGELLLPNEVDWYHPNLIKLVEDGDLPQNYTEYIINKMDDFDFKRELVSMNIIEFKKDVDVIKIFTNLEWFSAYSINGFLMDAGFINLHVSRAFNKWFNKIFKLHPNLQKKFDQYVRLAKPSPSTKLVCTQVRIGGARPNVEYDLNITPRNYTTYYWRFIRDNFLNASTSTMNYKIFVTSDMESVEAEASHEFGDENVVIIDGISAHMDRDSNENSSRYEKIVMDFFMLGYCDMALVSDSGFGVFGVMREKIPSNKHFYVISALRSQYKKAEIIPIRDFMYLNPWRY